MTIDTMIARVKDATARNDDLVCIEAEDRDALLAHIATLTRERDEALDQCADRDEWIYDKDDALDALRSRVETLESALKETQRYLIQAGIPGEWGRDVLKSIDTALTGKE